MMKDFLAHLREALQQVKPAFFLNGKEFSFKFLLVNFPPGPEVTCRLDFPRVVVR